MSPRFPVIGVMLASFAAGPAVVVPIGIYGISTGPESWLAFAWLPIFALLSVPFGIAFSVIPNFAGSALLTLLGGWHPVARYPVTWAATGFVFGWLISAGFFAEWGWGNVPLGLVGLVCALICRKGVDWAD